VTCTFGTMTAGLLTLDSWREEQQVGRLAMESTGVYGYRVYTLLEEGRSVILVNPQHMRAVPGRKPLSKTARGWRSCCAMACSKAAVSHPSLFATCAS
jgi:transposase